MPLAAFPKCYLTAMVDGEMSIEAWLDVAAGLDVDGVEFYWGITPHEAPDELDRIRAMATDRDLEIPMMCYSPDFTKPDPEARAAEVAAQKEAIEATARLGGSYCRVLSGQRRPSVDRKTGLDWVADCIRDCLPFAAERGVTLVLENHYKDDYWEHPEFAQQMPDFLALLDRVPEHPAFGVNYDPSNAIIADDDPYDLLEAVADRVVTMHASDRYLEGGTVEDLREIEAGSRGYADILEHGVVGEGLIDYDRVFETLSAHGFEGWISIEDGYDRERGETYLAQSAAFLREKMAAHDLP